jgi:diketogulonate reductase-like aldo/keto reductase
VLTCACLASQGKTPGQVAINWLLCKGVLPIPGVKNKRQAEEVAGALGWRLTPEEVRALEKASDAVGTIAFGAPFEKW